MALHSWPGAGRYAPENAGVCEGALWVMLSLDCIAVWFVPNFSRFFKIFLSF
jgi:hypothetical protein